VHSRLCTSHQHPLAELFGPRADEAGFIREDHRLDTVAQPELVEHVRDVRLHGRLADVQRSADLGIGVPARNASITYSSWSKVVRMITR
jgi:hypothetical protein